MNATERRAVSSLASIFALRMLGLFLILPVFAVYARQIEGFTPALAGLAIGVYGLTQAIFQIPFGMLSDRFGRKRVITIGLLVFALGCLVAAMADTIYGVIAGRALQGSGAIAAAVLALAADLTREQQRTKAMASIGASIGVAFMLALVLGPLLDGWVGVDGIFWITGALALAVLPVLWWLTPSPANRTNHGEVGFNPARFRDILVHPQLIRFDLGIFALHMALTAFFVVVPLQLVDLLGMESGSHWKVYIPVLLASVMGMLPILIYAHRTNRYSSMLALAIVLMICAEVVFSWSNTGFWQIAFGLWLFFCGFNALEAMLPSLISRLAPAGAKGTVMGVYNTFQFTGIFLGGLVGGWAYGVWGASGAFMLASSVLLVWLMLVLTAPPLRLLDSVTLRIESPKSDESGDLMTRLGALPGVEDGTLLQTEGIIYLKVDKDSFDPETIEQFPGVALV